MGRRQAAVAGSGNSAEFTHTLLARLGLPPEASPEQIEAAHDRLVAFLDSAPAELRSWARQQAKTADAAFALLSSPGADLPAEAIEDGQDGESTADESGEDDFDEDDFDEDDFDQDDRPARPAKARAVARNNRTAAAGRRKPTSQRANRSERRPAPAPSDSRRRLSRFSPVLVVVLIAALVYGVYQSGQTSQPQPQTGDAAASPTAQALDEEKVLALMNKLQSNPKDVETLRELGEVYFQAGDYKTAASWQQKIVDINPKDTNALLTLGLALFNTGDTASAEKQWLKVVEIDPKNAEAHYDLGFLHLSKNPPDTEKAKAEWSKVIELDPNSELAKVVSSHMNQLDSPSSTPSPSGSGK